MRLAEWSVVSDDLTGLQAIAGEFARAGLAVATSSDAQPSAADLRDTDVFGLETDTRGSDPKEAEGRVAEAARRLFQYGSSRLFKHNDSALRGHVAAELRGVLEGSGFFPIVYAPACPSRRRVTVGGVHMELDARGEPLPETAPIDLARRLQNEAGLESVLVDRATLLAGGAERLIRAAHCDVVIADAMVDDDLDELVRAAGHAGCRLFAGSIGLAAAVARAMRTMRRDAHPILVVAGSMQEATRRQVERLLARIDCACVELPASEVETGASGSAMHVREVLASGHHCVLRCPPPRMAHASAAYPVLPPAQLLAMRRTLGAVLRDVFAEGAALVDGIVATGGATAHLVLHDVLGITRLRNAAWLEEGMTMALAGDGLHPGMPVITKSGGWGRGDALGDAVDALVSWRCRGSER